MSNNTINPKGGYFAITPECKVHNEHDPAYATVTKDPIPAADLQRMEDGRRREDDISIEWSTLLGATELPQAVISAASGRHTFDVKVEATAEKLRGRKVVWVPECDRSTASKQRREVITMAAMEAGAFFIWNGRLPAANEMISEPDFLIRAGSRRKSNGKFAYRPGDVKDAKSFEGTAAAQPLPVSTMGNYRFEHADQRELSVGKPKKKHSMQLAHYHEHLLSFGYETTGDVWGGILGREGVIIWRNLSEPTIASVDAETGAKTKISILQHYRNEFASRKDVALAAINPEAVPLAFPELKTDCASCEFRTVCHDELVEADHITLLPGVTPTRAKALYDAGIETRGELAKLDYNTARLVETGVNVASLISEAKTWDDPMTDAQTLTGSKRAVVDVLNELQLETVGDLSQLHYATAEKFEGIKVTKLTSFVDAARVAKVGKVHLARGISKLEIPRGDIELHVDMENEAGGVIYLWGSRLDVNAQGLKIPGAAYRPFVSWDGSDEGEAQAFAGLWGWITALRTLATETGLVFRAYCYTAAEDRCMRHLVSKHAGYRGFPTAEELEMFIASDEWVDLYDVVAGQLVWPTENLSLKSVAKWARFSWRDSDASGDSSTVWYREAVSESDEHIVEAARERLLAYNEDDVAATSVLMEWLTQLSRARNPQQRVPSVADLNGRFVREPRRRARPRT